MDTELLYRAMYEVKHIRRQLGGVLAADMCCDQIKRPGLYVVTPLLPLSLEVLTLSDCVLNGRDF